MIRILVDLPFDSAIIEKLGQFGSVLVAPPPYDAPKVLPPHILTRQHILVCRYPPVNYHELKTLEFAQFGTVGYESFLEIGLSGLNFRICNARGVFDSAIGEWIISMMISLQRDLPSIVRNQDRHLWRRSPAYHNLIRDCTLGIWGYGGIGREAARLAKGFGMRVSVLTKKGVMPRNLCWTPPGTGDPQGILPDQVLTYSELPRFLRELDFLLVALPLTRDTVRIIGFPELQSLPPTACVINPARAAIIDEKALMDAMKKQWIRGAALDAHYHYPLPANHPLWELPNVILTPHIAGGTKASYYLRRIGELCLENVRRHVSGEPILNEVSHSELLNAQI